MTFYNVAKVIVRAIICIIFRVKIEGLSNIPKDGPCILCFNHKSLLDPPVIGVFIPRQLIFMAKEELFKIPVLGFIIRKLGAFPVKRGVGDIAAIRTSLDVLKQGKVLAMFPEGTRNKDNTIGQAKPGIALIAIRAQAPVVPVGVGGQYKLFHRLSIRVGKPIVLEEYYNQKLPVEKLSEISNEIMNHIRELAEVN
ncbi:MAG: 1-acyl-sn-glycerol-3-phosphate acyltransferase [Clostridiaceae bacterium]|nr:1-acyl-sn-glycerol-3-phosphate acyltransferase [Clostridiaceae bacterium]